MTKFANHTEIKRRVEHPGYLWSRQEHNYSMIPGPLVLHSGMCRQARARDSAVL